MTLAATGVEGLAANNGATPSDVQNQYYYVNNHSSCSAVLDLISFNQNVFSFHFSFAQVETMYEARECTYAPLRGRKLPR
jgi:hypothetical protein